MWVVNFHKVNDIYIIETLLNKYIPSLMIQENFHAEGYC